MHSTSIIEGVVGFPGLGDAGATGILVMVVLLILTGRLAPRRALEDERQNTRDWRQAHDALQEALRMSQEQNRDLIEVTETVDRILRALPTPPERRDEPA